MAEEALSARLRRELATEAWLDTVLAGAAADVLTISLDALIRTPGQVARSMGAVMPPYVPLGPLVAGVDVPEDVERIMDRLLAKGDAPAGLDDLARLVGSRAQTARALSQKI